MTPRLGHTPNAYIIFRSVQIPRLVEFVDPAAEGNLNIIMNHMWKRMSSELKGHWFGVFVEAGWIYDRIRRRKSGLVKNWRSIATQGIAEIVARARDGTYDHFIRPRKKQNKEYDNEDEVSTLL